MSDNVDVSSRHQDLVRIVTAIVEDAAMRTLVSPSTAQRRIDYIRARSREASDLAQQVATEVAEAMIKLVQTDAFLNIPLMAQPEHLSSSRYRPCQLSPEQTTKKSNDISTR